MTISIWRYSHLLLAVSSFVFIFLASVTGIILAFEPISEQIQPYKVEDFETISLAETLHVLQQTYPEILEVEVDANQFVLASVITEEGESLNGYINPKTGEYLGDKIEVAPFFQWTTNLHRSLFLKGIGRFFVGLCSFLLFLIAASGSVLILKRQRSFKKFFSKIVNENFAQYWHVVLGRLSLIPIIIITVTGVYLSLEKFDLLPKEKLSHTINFEALSETPKQNIADFLIFKNTKLSEIKAIEFPFSSDVEDYFTLKLKDKEVVVNQFTGAILSEVKYPLVLFFSNLSINLHTGKGSVLWSVILAIACVNILFFIYSGFAMTLKRRSSKLKNKYKKDDAEYIILVGSENGSTLAFANALHHQLLKIGESSYISELNNYSIYKKVKHIIAITGTYGEGEAPTNANRFLELLEKTNQKQMFDFSVVGFGSYAYPDFCKFAFDVNDAFQNKEDATQFLEPFAINDKSVDAFNQWVNLWSNKAGLQVSIPNETLDLKAKKTKSFTVISKTSVKDNPNNTFLITLKSNSKQRFTSGDLLAIYPENNYRERLYSIGEVDGNIQLSVKYYDNGLGSNYLNDFQIEETFKARIISNSAFHFPTKASRVVLIANGTGIAPFLGMLNQNKKKIETHLYYGLRQSASFEIYNKQIKENYNNKHLSKLNLAFSQQEERHYVQDLIQRDAKFIAETLQNKGVIMICGSLAMQKEVLKVIEEICFEQSKNTLNYYQAQKQIKTDCY